jgi:hypothetical protein
MTIVGFRRVSIPFVAIYAINTRIALCRLREIMADLVDRAVTVVQRYGADSARTHLRDRFPGADPEDPPLLADLLGIRDSAMPLTDIAPDARRRRCIADRLRAGHGRGRVSSSV